MHEWLALYIDLPFLTKLFMVQIHVNLLLLVILHFYWLWNNMDAVSCFRHIILVKHIAKRYDELLSISIFASIVATVALSTVTL